MNMLLFFAGWEGGNLGRIVKEDDLPLFSASVVSLLDSEMDFWKAKDDDLARFLEEQMKSFSALQTGSSAGRFKGRSFFPNTNLGWASTDLSVQCSSAGFNVLCMVCACRPAAGGAAWGSLPLGRPGLIFPKHRDPAAASKPAHCRTSL